MTKKEFREHDWKVGDVLYQVAFNEYKYISIPYKVHSVRVRIVENSGRIYTDGKKFWPFNFDETDSNRYKNFFFTKEEANKRFKELKSEFVANHKDRVVKTLKEMERRLYKNMEEELDKINSLLKMDILAN